MASIDLATLDHDALIDRLASGAILRTLATETGYPQVHLYDQLRNHPRYPAAIQAQAESLVEAGDEEMMSSELPPDTAYIAARTREVDTAFKWAAARDPLRWGAKVVAWARRCNRA